MDFSTHFSKKRWHSCLLAWLRAFAVLIVVCGVQAQVPSVPSDTFGLKVERSDDEILISTQAQFELTSAVEDALQKGLPIYFIAEAEVMRERWYWYDKRVGAAERHLRLAYQPLSRRWKLTTSAGASRSGSLGLTLTQNFDSLAQALTSIKRISRWKIADVAELDSSLRYRVEFGFRLDLNQLPLPFQIGAIGQSDWNVSISSSAPLILDQVK
jgi:hypothetical protein